MEILEPGSRVKRGEKQVKGENTTFSNLKSAPKNCARVAYRPRSGVEPCACGFADVANG